MVVRIVVPMAAVEIMLPKDFSFTKLNKVATNHVQKHIDTASSQFLDGAFGDQNLRIFG